MRGYGRMSWVDAAAYAEAEPDPLAVAAAGIIEHMKWTKRRRRSCSAVTSPMPWCLQA